MVYHVPQFLDRFGSIKDIAVDQVERKNLDHRESFFASTQRGGGNHVYTSEQVLICNTLVTGVQTDHERLSV